MSDTLSTLPLMHRSPRGAALCAALGAASVLAFAPVGAFPLLPLTLGILFLVLRTAASPRQGALYGWAFGSGLFLAGVSWVYVSLSIFGGMPAWLAGLATLLFCLVLALYPALAGALAVRLRSASPTLDALAFAALWTLTEWLRGWLLTGFPWLAAGYAQTPPSPLAGYAPVVGVYGLSFASALIGALGAACILETTAGRALQGRRKAVVAGLAVMLVLAGGALLRGVAWTTPHGAPITVALLQGNVPQDLKWRPELFDASLRTYYQLALDHPAQLTVLPETALPAFYDRIPRAYLETLAGLARRQDGDLLLGVPTGDSQGYANSVVSLGNAPSQRYDKQHLVPFGEFVPPGFRWFMAQANIPMSDFTPGAANQPPFAVAGQRVAANICYEDAFGTEIARAVPQATLLVNLSNVAWFGDSLAPQQHLQIARLRALETGRTMLRATNTGMTAIVAPDGAVLGALPPFTRGALRGEAQGYTGETPYVRWGDAPLLALAALIATLVALAGNFGLRARRT